MDLLQRLHQEHQALIETFQQIREAGWGTPQSKDILSRAERLFFAHLKLEEREFYPVLRKASESDPELHNTLLIYDQEMREIAHAILDFFGQCGQDTEPQELTASLERNDSHLRQRILREEHVLFPRFKQISAPKETPQVPG